MKTLKNWYIDRFDTAHGSVKGSDKFPDGSLIHTSTVSNIKVNEETGDVEIHTRNSVYHANLSTAIFENFWENNVISKEDVKKYAEKFNKASSYLDGLVGDVAIIALDSDVEYFFSYFVYRQGDVEHIQKSPYVHTSITQDSVLMGDLDLDFRYFPYADSIEFYLFEYDINNVYIKNVGEKDMKVVIPSLGSMFNKKMLTIEPGQLIHITEELLNSIE